MHSYCCVPNCGYSTRRMASCPVHFSGLVGGWLQIAGLLYPSRFETAHVPIAFEAVPPSGVVAYL